jgi:hypothetical protein
MSPWQFLPEGAFLARRFLLKRDPTPEAALPHRLSLALAMVAARVSISAIDGVTDAALDYPFNAPQSR